MNGVETIKGEMPERVKPGMPLMRRTDAWAGLYAAHDAGRAAERADVLTVLRQHQAVLVRHGATQGEMMELRRINELIASLSAGLHVGGAGA